MGSHGAYPCSPYPIQPSNVKAEGNGHRDRIVIRTWPLRWVMRGHARHVSALISKWAMSVDDAVDHSRLCTHAHVHAHVHVHVHVPRHVHACDAMRDQNAAWRVHVWSRPCVHLNPDAHMHANGIRCKSLAAERRALVSPHAHVLMFSAGVLCRRSQRRGPHVVTCTRKHVGSPASGVGPSMPMSMLCIACMNPSETMPTRYPVESWAAGVGGLRSKTRAAVRGESTASSAHEDATQKGSTYRQRSMLGNHFFLLLPIGELFLSLS